MKLKLTILIHTLLSTSFVLVINGAFLIHSPALGANWRTQQIKTVNHRLHKIRAQINNLKQRLQQARTQRLKQHFSGQISQLQRNQNRLQHKLRSLQGQPHQKSPKKPYFHKGKRPHSPPTKQTPSQGFYQCQSPQSTLQCLVCNCVHEAKNEPYQGKVAVGKVVLSRVLSQGYPNNPCGVIYKFKAFSWANTMQSRKPVPKGGACGQAMKSTLAQHRKTPRIWKLNYFADYIYPADWGDYCVNEVKIGHHRFFDNCKITNRPNPKNRRGLIPSSKKRK